MAHPQTPGSAPSNLTLRVVSALVLAPPVLAALYFGPPFSDLFVILAAAIMAWEWSTICGGATLTVARWAAIATVVAAVVLGAFRLVELSSWVAIAGAMTVAVLALRHDRQRSAWLVMGTVYLSLACVAFGWLRQHPDIGLQVILWLVAVVWATDIGAYFAGRGLGGPKLAPSISPNKTWAGLLGGMLAAFLVGLALAFLSDEMRPHELAIQSAVVALISQVGDLFESRLKRKFDVKDSSQLIPGHGGLLDRADGLLAASLWVAFVVWFARGAA